jgi:micrococcal nuclease
MATQQPHDHITRHPEYARVYYHYMRHGVSSEDAARRAYEYTQRQLAGNAVAPAAPRSNRSPTTLMVVLAGVAVGVLLTVVGVVASSVDTKRTAAPQKTSSAPPAQAESLPPIAAPSASAPVTTTPPASPSVLPTTAQPTLVRPPAVVPRAQPPAPALSLRIVSLPATGQGNRATAAVSTSPRASCSIVVEYKSGPSKAAGLGARAASGAGKVSWTWLVGTRTTPGDWPVTVSCSSGSQSRSAQRYLTVLDTGKPG